MKVLMINVMCGIRSTGRICTDIAKALKKQGHEVVIAYGRGDVPIDCKEFALRIETDTGVKIHAIKARLFDRCGFGSVRATKKFVKWIKEYDPDVIHLHNLHGYYIDIRTLFYYLKKCEKKIIWTLHDCWAFTGHCGYFDAISCEKWKTQCFNCANGHEYPARLLIDSSRKNYIEKMNMFQGVDNLRIITPSKWLASMVKESFLKEYPIEVINNGVDTGIFRATSSSLKKELGLEDKKIVLGVAAVWSKRKGLEDFIELSAVLPNDYHIILIGITKEQKNKVPSNITALEKTDSPKTLAEYYTMATVYVNPTYEDNYPTTNLESIACGTPVITYDTGGSPESVPPECVIAQGDIHALKELICKGKLRICDDVHVNKETMVNKYLELYQ